MVLDVVTEGVDEILIVGVTEGVVDTEIDGVVVGVGCTCDFL